MRPTSPLTNFRLERTLTKHKLQEIESFISHSRQGMRTTWDRFSVEFDKVMANLTEQGRSEHFDQVYDDIETLRDDSPQLLRHAQCMIVYGTFEKRMAALCRAVYSDGKIAEPPPRKIYMCDAKGYLRQSIGSSQAAFGSEWEWMVRFRVIRNWMAHNGGTAERDDKAEGNWTRANKFVGENSGLISLSLRDEILVEDGFVDRAVEKATSAITIIENAVDRIYL